MWHIYLVPYVSPTQWSLSRTAADYLLDQVILSCAAALCTVGGSAVSPLMPMASLLLVVAKMSPDIAKCPLEGHHCLEPML